MNRLSIFAWSTIFVAGCGSQTEQNVPVANKVDSATYVRPIDEKIGTVTMKEFCDDSGLKMYPKSESATGEKFAHGEGVTKNVVTFVTNDTSDLVSKFYKEQGLDTKIPSKPIGMTKSGAQIMVSITPKAGGTTVVEIKSLVSAKKGP